MNQAYQNESAPLSWLPRIALLAFGCVLLGLLVTAARLQPNPAGMGTHQQLGLPPCTFRVLFNSRCPACGMTTSWSRLVRGQAVESMRANTGGALLAGLAMFASPWMIVSALRGRWILAPPSDWMVLIVAATILIITIADWTFRLLAAP